MAGRVPGRVPGHRPGGTPHTVFPTTYAELLRICAGEPVEVTPTEA